MTGWWRALHVALALAVSGVSGCGGSADDACGRVQPCGGDVVGTWQLSSTCANPPPLPGKLCADATVRHSSYDVSGTATFGADLSFSISATETGTIEVSVPATCLMMGAATQSCDQITPEVPSGVNVRCVESGDGCLCTFVLLSHDVGEAGTYVTNGSMLTETPTNGAVATVGTCVAGDRLHVLTLAPDSTAPVVIGDLVGRKK